MQDLTFHGLSHSHATMLATLGVGIKGLGHSTSRMMIEDYTLATTTTQDAAVVALGTPWISGSAQKQSDHLSGQNARIAVARVNENPAMACGIKVREFGG